MNNEINKETKEIAGIQNFDNNPMLSTQQTISHTPEKFVIDFQAVTMQFDPGSVPTMIVNHRVIILDPYRVRPFINALTENLARYEEKFGLVKEPESIEKAKKEMELQEKTEKKLSKAVTRSKPDYMG